MDPSRFDNLARVLSAASGRRPLLAAVLGAALGGALDDAAAKKRGKSRRRNQQARDANARLAAERGGAGAKRRKKSKKKRRGGNDGGQPPPPPPDCCGTDSCPDPEPGSTSSDCDFAGRSFAGQDLNGSIFRGIDGRGTNFNQTQNHGSIFAEACLQGARFRRARLDGSTWEDACLFDADFTGAKLDDDDPLFAEGLFCNTTMPDGTVNDRDCGEATPCCQARPDPGPSCQRASDCADQPCQTKACQNGTCVYDEIFDNGPSPNNLCTFCCDGDCCLSPANQCNPANSCCAPNCAGRVCGPDGCGGTGTCGPDCPVQAGQRCNAAGQCVCDAVSCPDGCCEQQGQLGPLCWPGDTVQRCGEDGETCQTCGAGQGCVNQRCVSCTPQCAGRQCGPDGCGGQCGECDGLLCDEETGQCLCAAQVCSGCCSNGPNKPGVCRLNPANTCGTNGQQCVSCPPPGACNAQGQCVCTPNCAGKTCGDDGCGGSCGECPPGEICGDPFPGQCACTAGTCPTGTECCPAGETDRCLAVDGGVCDQDGDCCSGDCCGGTVCCAGNQTCCGETCCDPGQFCCNGTCCNQPCCGDACCLPGQPCCGGTCCCAPGLGGDCCGDNDDICCDECGPTYVCCGNGECGLLRGSECQFPGSFDTECCSTQCDNNGRCT